MAPVFIDTGAFIARAVAKDEYHETAVRAWSSLRDDRTMIVSSLRAALAVMRKFADQSISFTDCVSFALMRRERMKIAFSFDKHFSIAGFDRYSGALP